MSTIVPASNYETVQPTSMKTSVPSHSKYQKNAVPFYIMWIFVGLSFFVLLSDIGAPFSYISVVRVTNMVCSAFFMIWMGIALHKEAFLLEEAKLFWRCLPWLGMVVFSGITSVIAWWVETDIYLREQNVSIFLMRSVLGVTLFFCFRYSRFFRPWRYAQSVLPHLPQYSQPQA